MRIAVIASILLFLSVAVAREVPDEPQVPATVAARHGVVNGFQDIVDALSTLVPDDLQHPGDLLAQLEDWLKRDDSASGALNHVVTASTSAADHSPPCPITADQLSLTDAEAGSIEVACGGCGLLAYAQQDHAALLPHCQSAVITPERYCSSCFCTYIRVTAASLGRAGVTVTASAATDPSGATQAGLYSCLEDANKWLQSSRKLSSATQAAIKACSSLSSLQQVQAYATCTLATLDPSNIPNTTSPSLEPAAPSTSPIPPNSTTDGTTASSNSSSSSSLSSSSGLPRIPPINTTAFPLRTSSGVVSSSASVVLLSVMAVTCGLLLL